MSAQGSRTQGIDTGGAAFSLPRLYPIVDAGLLRRSGISFESFAMELRIAGIRFLQLRDKESPDGELLARARILRSIFPAGDATLILNDRPDLCVPAGFDGVHLGQEDDAPEKARAMIGPERILGYSTHNAAQMQAAAGCPVDYLAIGPVFATTSKERPDPVVGPGGVREARRLTRRPLVAIGGITEATSAEVMRSGADSLALISALLPSGGRSVAEVLRDILAAIG